MTADLAERYAHQLNEIGRRVISMHTCQVYDPERMEYEHRPALCGACDIERILDKEPPA